MTASPAWAHTELKSSDPADGSSLSSAPTTVTLTFEEAVTLPGNPIEVTGPDGSSWTVGTATISGASVSAPVEATGPVGQYTLRYTVTADDGDAVKGTVRFTLTSAATPATTEVATPTTAAAAAPVTAAPAPELDLINTQNIWGRVSLTRNANLLAGVPTASAFVYTVPDARMPAPATPLVSVTDALDLTAVPVEPPDADPDPTGRRQLVEWLINFFDSLVNRYAVLGDDTLPKIAARFGLGLAELVPAVADIPGLLLAGTPLALPGGAYTARSTDTLRGIATARSAPVADVVDAASASGVALTAGTLLRPVATSRFVRVGVDYGFPVVAMTTDNPTQQGEIVSRLPVLLRPMFLLDSATDLRPDAGFCADLARGLTSWASARGVPEDVGMWVLDISLYTTLPSASAPTSQTPAAAAPAPPDTAPPLLQLSNVRLPRDRVAAAADARPTTENTP